MQEVLEECDDKNLLAIFPNVVDSNGAWQSIYVYNTWVDEILQNIFYPIYFIRNRFIRNRIYNKSLKCETF